MFILISSLKYVILMFYVKLLWNIFLKHGEVH